MNSLWKGLALLTLTHNVAFALHPVQGWYGGLLLGANYTPSTNFSFPSTSAGVPVAGALNYGMMGDIGGQFGYRFEKFRAEGQFFYNNSPYKSLEINGATIFAPSVNTTGYRVEGSTDLGAVMFNGYYDFFTNDTSRNLIPYIGAGVGYSYVSNKFNLYYQEVAIDSAQIKSHVSTAAGEVIVGASYFLDDFTFFGLDARYFTTVTKSSPLDARVQVYSLNLSFNGAFNIA